MDLTLVLEDLRSELENVDLAISSLEKLADIRKRRHNAEDAAVAEASAASPKVARGKRGSSDSRVEV